MQDENQGRTNPQNQVEKVLITNEQTESSRGRLLRALQFRNNSAREQKGFQIYFYNYVFCCQRKERNNVSDRRGVKVGEHSAGWGNGLEERWGCWDEKVRLQQPGSSPRSSECSLYRAHDSQAGRQQSWPMFSSDCFNASTLLVL